MPNRDSKDAIVLAALPDVPFDGWTLPVLEKAAMKRGYAAAIVPSIFPAGVKDAIRHFAAMADDGMLQSLKSVDPQTLKVRQRVTEAVWVRLQWLAQYKEAERLAVAYWMRPLRKFEGLGVVWKTADAIWDWAGDTATDYNRYTKRVLLSGVITATTLYWLSDTSSGHADSRASLERRIDNALSIGRIAGKLKRA